MHDNPYLISRFGNKKELSCYLDLIVLKDPITIYCRLDKDDHLNNKKKIRSETIHSFFH